MSILISESSATFLSITFSHPLSCGCCKLKGMFYVVIFNAINSLDTPFLHKRIKNCQSNRIMEQCDI